MTISLDAIWPILGVIVLVGLAVSGFKNTTPTNKGKNSSSTKSEEK